MKDNTALATELLSEQITRAKRWRTAFITALSLLVIAVGVICYLLSVR